MPGLWLALGLVCKRGEEFRVGLEYGNRLGASHGLQLTHLLEFRRGLVFTHRFLGFCAFLWVLGRVSGLACGISRSGVALSAVAA